MSTKTLEDEANKPKHKVVILGLGNVGRETVDKLGVSQLMPGVEIAIYEAAPDSEKIAKSVQAIRQRIIAERRNEWKGEGEPESLSPKLVVYDNIEKALEGAHVVVVTAAAPRNLPQAPSLEKKIELNSPIIKDIAHKIKAYAPRDVQVILSTNPVRHMAPILQAEAELNPGQVVGLSGTLEDARLTQSIAQNLGLKSSSDVKRAFVLTDRPDNRANLPVLAYVQVRRGADWVPLHMDIYEHVGRDHVAAEALWNKIQLDCLASGQKTVEGPRKPNKHGPASSIVELVRQSLGAITTGEASYPIELLAHDKKNGLFTPQRGVFTKKGFATLSMQWPPGHYPQSLPDDLERYGDLVGRTDVFNSKLVGPLEAPTFPSPPKKQGHKSEYILVVGGGNVGLQTAEAIATHELAKKVIVWNRDSSSVPKIKAEIDDLNLGLIARRKLIGGDIPDIEFTTDLAKALKEHPDIVVVTAGIARSARNPDLNTRKDLAKANGPWMDEIALQIKEHSEDSRVIVASNPVDTFTWRMVKTGGLNPAHVVGLGGETDSMRMIDFIVERLDLPSPEYVRNAFVVAPHSDFMIPEFDAVEVYSKEAKKWIGLSQALEDMAGVSKDKVAAELEAMKRKIVGGGKSFSDVLGTSDHFGPTGAIVQMIKQLHKGIETGQSDVISCSSRAPNLPDVPSDLAPLWNNQKGVFHRDGFEPRPELEATNRRNEAYRLGIKDLVETARMVPPLARTARHDPGRKDISVVGTGF